MLYVNVCTTLYVVGLRTMFLFLLFFVFFFNQKTAYEMRISDWSSDVCSSDLRHFLNLYKLGAGPYYCFYAPFHLCHFEVPNSIARAVLFDDAVLAPASSPVVGVVAVAKKNLNDGETIEEFGGHEAYGVAENYDVTESRSEESRGGKEWDSTGRSRWGA